MWRRFVLIVFALFAALVIPPVGCYTLRRWQAENELEAVVAELDREDPDWRWEALEGGRLKVSKEKNAADVVMAAARLLPRRRADQEFYIGIAKLPANVALSNGQAEKLTRDLAGMKAAVSKAKQLAVLDTGRFELSWSEFDAGSPSHLDAVVLVASTLRYASALESEKGDFDEAARLALALLRSGTAVGDEPCLKSQWIRIGIRILAVETVERILGQDRQGKTPVNLLDEIQHAFWHESRQKVMIPALRGERYRVFSLATRLASGEEKLPEASSDYWSRFVRFYSQPMVLRSTAWMLRAYTRWIEFAGLPVSDRWRRFRRATSETTELLADDSSLLLAKILVPRSLRAAADDVRSIAHLRLAIVGIACERYRRQEGRWPKELVDVPAKWLPREAAIDPFTDQPIRFQRDASGLTLNAGDHEGGEASESARIRFRLWAVENRGKRP